MTAPRTRRAAPGRSLLSTFVCVVLLLLVARALLLECGSGALPGLTPPAVSPPAVTASAGAAEAPRHELPAASTDFAHNVHLALGIPQDADASDDHLLDERAYVVSYSPVKRVPNWAAWRLDKSNLGHVKRRNDFRPDPSLPAELFHVTESDYARSGYDRGHLCPSADREDTAEDNSTTFLFTNMQPQLHELNAGPWERLEAYERQRALQGDVLYIVAGGVFSAPFPTIGHGVAVPAANFKIIVALRAGQKPEDISSETDVIAALMPNERGVGEHLWTDFLTSVDALEQASGYDFLNAIPEPIQRVIEARIGRP